MEVSIVNKKEMSDTQHPVQLGFVLDAQHRQKRSWATSDTRLQGDVSRALCDGEGECGGFPAVKISTE